MNQDEEVEGEGSVSTDVPAPRPSRTRRAAWIAVLALVALLLIREYNMSRLRTGLRPFLTNESGDASFIVHNTTSKTLEHVVLDTDKGVFDLGTVGPGQTLIDPRPAGLGQIDYRLLYTLDGKRMASRDLYTGGRPLAFRLYHRFTQTPDGQYRWLEYLGGDLSGLDIEGQTDAAGK